MKSSKKNYKFKHRYWIVISFILIFDIPVPHKLESHDITVWYNQYVFNRFVFDIITMDHAPQNDYLKRNAIRKLCRKLSVIYLDTGDTTVSNTILYYFNNDKRCQWSYEYKFPNSKVSIDTLCKYNKIIFSRLRIL